MTLTDSYGRAHSYLRISLTDRCNLRCTYCMPQDHSNWMTRASLMTADEIERLARLFVSMGVTKIRLTGGEPTLRKDLIEIVERLVVIPGLKQVTMTTNGLTLPEQAVALRTAGLTGLTVSLDSLRRERFAAITKRDQLLRVQNGIEAALHAGFTPLKINAVVMGGVNDDELCEFVALTRDQPLHIRFIEYMPFHGTSWSEASLLPYAEMVQRIEASFAITELRGAPGAVGLDYSIDGHRGMIGFVTSMSRSFCSTCNRIRLTADGHLKTCLFSAREVYLLGNLREGADDAELNSVIRTALFGKPEGHPPMGDLLKQDNRIMVEISG